MSRGELPGLFRRMATLLEAGVSLAPALEFLAGSAESVQSETLLNFIHGHVVSGHPLSTALGHDRMGKSFSPVVIGMIKLGESTGHLAEVVSHLADLLERQQKLERSAISALTYPAVLAAVIMTISGFFVLLLGNKDSGLFAALSGELPWATRILIATADYLKSPRFLLFLVSSVLLSVYTVRRLFAASPTLRRSFHGYLLQIPALGALLSKSSSARMLYVVATASAVGMPLMNSLYLAKSVCTNLQIAEQYEAALAKFRDGEELASTLEEHRVFSKMVTSMISVGLESGKLDSILLSVSNLLAEDVEDALHAFVRLVEPILLGVAGGVATFLALAALQPLISVVDAL